LNVKGRAMPEFERRNRERLISLLSTIPFRTCPDGWRPVGAFSIGRLTDIGFSQDSELLLVLSSTGRGVIDPSVGLVVARDDEPDGAWLSESKLLCEGIGALSGEVVHLAGLRGSGLPRSSGKGESLELFAPNWPVQDLIYCSNFGLALIERHPSSCVRLASDHVRAFGFSWSGNTFVYATGSDVYLFARLNLGDRHATPVGS
jgi:hypothetical protein